MLCDRACHKNRPSRGRCAGRQQVHQAGAGCEAVMGHQPDASAPELLRELASIHRHRGTALRLLVSMHAAVSSLSLSLSQCCSSICMLLANSHGLSATWQQQSLDCNGGVGPCNLSGKSTAAFAGMKSSLQVWGRAAVQVRPGAGVLTCRGCPAARRLWRASTLPGAGTLLLPAALSAVTRHALQCLTLLPRKGSADQE